MSQTNTVFKIPSETYAEKTRRILARNHIRYTAQRITTPEGCTALFTAYAAPEQIFALLRANQIPHRTDD